MSWRAVVLTGVLYVAAPAAAQTCASPPDDEICALVSAEDVESLDAAMAATTSQHIGIRALYRTRRYELRKTAEEERRYLRSLPRTREDLWCVYSLTLGPLMDESRVSETVDGMFMRAARIARRLGIGHDRVIHLALWSDGDLGYSAWDAFTWLLVNDTELTSAAMKRLKPEEQIRICGSPVSGLRPSQIVKRCSVET